MRRFIRRCWRLSWVITLPVTVFFFYWLYQTTERYDAFALQYNSHPHVVRVRDVGRQEFKHLIRNAELAIKGTWATSAESDEDPLRTIYLFAAESDLETLNSNLPHSGFEYVPGAMLNDGSIRKVSLRYRGDFFPHWGRFKKSYRVKTKKGSLFEGMRRFNLIAPKFRGQLQTFLSYRLVDLLDFVGPRTELVNVAMNGTPRGMHVLVEQLGESTLRSNNRMPGDLYSGELIARDQRAGIASHVFDHPRLWKKVAVNNHFSEDSFQPLEELIRVLSLPETEEKHLQLSHLVDFEAFGKFFAFETLSQSRHFNWNHNWRLYYDPWTTRFSPLVWDPIGWAPHFMPKRTRPTVLDVVETRLHATLLNNGNVIRARHRTIQDFFQSGKVEVFLNEVKKAVAQATPAIMSDPNLIESNPRETVATMKKLENAISDVLMTIQQEYLTRKVDDVRFSVGSAPDVIPFSIAGRQPLERIVLRFLRPLDRVPDARIITHTGSGMQEVDVTNDIAINGANLELKTGLLAGYRPVRDGTGDEASARKVEIVPEYYELHLSDYGEANELLEVLVDMSTGELETPSITPSLIPELSSGTFDAVPTAPSSTPTIWAGQVNITGTMEVEEDIVIRPGTQIFLAPGASIIFRGRLHAVGTMEESIRFIPARHGQEPWGTVALKGKGANGSRLAACEFAHGSGLKGPLYEYSGMFSVHNVDDVRVEACLFRDSQIVDDMVHTVYTDIRFTNCVFLKANLDAVDIDISHASFLRCRFKESGNDLLDLMTSTVTVHECTLTDGGDKGISVGEGSKLFLLNSAIRDNHIGVQVKDGSTAVLYNVDLESNTIAALDAYQKNWRYGNGGDLFVYKCHIKDDQAITADKNSHLWMHDSYLPDSVSVDARHVDLDHVDSERKRGPSHPVMWRFPEEELRTRGLFTEYWGQANSKRRGVVIVPQN